MSEIAKENPEIGIFKVINNNISQKRKFDEFYTTDKIVNKCFDILKNELQKLKIDLNKYIFIEPSAGLGSFYRKMPQNKRIGIEINPNLNKEYFVTNYLDFKPQKK